MRLANKVALLSGGANGLGAEGAIAMAAAGARVVISDRDTAAGNALCARIGPAARFVEHDALSEPGWAALVEEVGATEGRLDILLNCVGGVMVDPIDVVSLDNWHRTLALNLDSAFLGCKHAMALMRDSGGGSIINFASTMGHRARGDSVSYATAKAGILMLTRSVAIRYGELGYKIRCNSISPGTVLTEMTEATLAGLVTAGRAPDRQAAIDMITATRPLRRLGEAQDIASAILFLASEDSSYVTGIDILVDGGYCAT